MIVKKNKNPAETYRPYFLSLCTKQQNVATNIRKYRSVHKIVI